jgi:Carboxypeptidase regulatory-like domain
MPRPSSLVLFVGLLFCLALCPSLRADTIAGTVKDPSSAVVVAAHIEITGEGLVQPIVLTSDEAGKFTAPNLNSGKCSVRVTKDGFEPLVSQIDLRRTSILELTLKIAEQVTSVNVSDKNFAFANSDSAYRQLRDVGFGDSYVCENFVFNMDVGSFQLKSGTLTFLKPVNGMITAPKGTDHDQRFIDMMHDFVESHRDGPASTESFKAIAEKHMTKEMDLQKNGRLDWYFGEWVYGQLVPKYELTNEAMSAEGVVHKYKVHITQSEVDANFVMFVPVFADFGSGLVRLGQMAVVGNSTRTVIFDLERQPKKIVLNAYKDILER